MNLFIISSISLFTLVLIFSLLSSKSTKKLPPGPSKLRFLTEFVYLRKSYHELGPIISKLSKKYGPLVTFYLGSRPTVFITNNILAHQALIQNGATFAGRPNFINNLIGTNLVTISSTSYGPTWRSLRRNLTGGVLSPSNLKSYSFARKRVLENLISQLKKASNSKCDGNGNGRAIFVADYFRQAVSFSLVLLCFGENIDEDLIRKIEATQKEVFSCYQRMKLFFIMPRVGKFLFRRLWNELNDEIVRAGEFFLSIIRSRKKFIEENSKSVEDDEQQQKQQSGGVCYVDTLLNLKLPGEEENIGESQILGLSSELISAGTDSTTTALMWIMANLVKYPSIQEKIFAEISSNLGQKIEYVGEDDIDKLPYLKAVILEGLRRHPPGYAPATPHAVVEDVELGGYLIPKGTAVNYLIPDVGRDLRVWENPMEFMPERFLKGEYDGHIFGSEHKEIKMMPFGAGRRICPGNGVAMLLLSYLVANSVLKFRWWLPEGEDVDLTEKYEVTINMKNPLKAIVTPRMC